MTYKGKTIIGRSEDPMIPIIDFVIRGLLFIEGILLPTLIVVQVFKCLN